MGYMSTAKTLQIVSTSSADTEQFAAALGQQLKGGEVIELISDLGGGKTTFVRGLARGAKSPSQVTSPTFKISNVYQAPSFDIHHFDFYRLGEAGIIGDELAEVIAQPNTVTVVEWGALIKSVLPQDRLTITFTTTGNDTRQLIITYPQTLSYLVVTTLSQQ